MTLTDLESHSCCFKPTRRDDLPSPTLLAVFVLCVFCALYIHLYMFICLYVHVYSLHIGHYIALFYCIFLYDCALVTFIIKGYLT